MARQVERRERTRALLIAVAADCFETLGYAQTSLDAIVQRAEVSKGALYHHFASKADLLEAVFEAVSRETVAAARHSAASATSPRDALGLSLKGWLRAVLAPRPRCILLDIGPGVLGFARARAIEAGSSEAVMRAAVARIVAQGEASCPDQELAVRLLNAAATELALTAMEQGCDGAGLARFESSIDTLIDALLPPVRPIRRKRAAP